MFFFMMWGLRRFFPSDVGIEINFTFWCGDFDWLLHLMWGVRLMIWGLKVISLYDMGIELDFPIWCGDWNNLPPIWCGDWAWLTHLTWGLSLITVWWMWDWDSFPHLMWGLSLYLYTVSDVGIEKAFPIWCGDWNLFPIWCGDSIDFSFNVGIEIYFPSWCTGGVEIDFIICWDSFPILRGDWDSFPNLIWGLRLNDTHNQAPLSKTLLNYVIELHRRCDPLTSPFPPINPTWKSP